MAKITISLNEDDYNLMLKAKNEYDRILGIQSTVTEFMKFCALWTIRGFMRDDVGDQINDNDIQS